MSVNLNHFGEKLILRFGLPPIVDTQNVKSISHFFKLLIDQIRRLFGDYCYLYSDMCVATSPLALR